jgi:hypothetical protein
MAFFSPNYLKDLWLLSALLPSSSFSLRPRFFPKIVRVLLLFVRILTFPEIVIVRKNSLDLAL